MSINSPKLPKATPKQEKDEIDLLALFWVMLRGWKIILAFAIAGLLLGVLYGRYVNPVYKADALVQIDEKSIGLSALGSNISELVAPEVSLAETERELIQSRMVLEPVVDQLHLDTRLADPLVNTLDRLSQTKIATTIHSTDGVALDTEDGQVEISEFEVPQAYLNKSFTLTATKSGFDLSDGINHFVGQVGEASSFKTTAGDISITVAALPVGDHPVGLTKLSLQTATDALNNALTVTEQGQQTGIIQLSLTGSNQEQVSRILEQVVVSYVNQNQARGSEQTTTTIGFMESQIPNLRQKLETSEAAFNKFRETYGTIDVSQEAELLLTESYQIDAQLNQLNLQRAELSTYYTDEHPLVTQINDQLKVLLNRKQEINETIARLPEIQREFLQLSEDMEINREIYLTMLKNYEQLKIVKAGEIGYVRVIDLPISSFRPIAPKKLRIWILALILGAMLGSTLVLLRSLLRNTVKDPERLETKSGVPVIATIPSSKAVRRLGKSKRTPNRLLARVDNESLSYEAIKSLRTFLLFGMVPSIKSFAKGKVILLTGESPKVGKSFITANLAEVFAQLDKKILVIDGDIRLGQLHKIFSIDHDSGLTEYLTSHQGTQSQPKPHLDTELTHFIHPTCIQNIDLMPRGGPSNNPASLLASEGFKNLIKQVIQHYDYVFIDSAPVLAASDALIISQYADKVLLVTRYDQSIEGQLVYAIKQMHKANVEVDGIVLNDMNQSVMNRYSCHYNYAYG
ncbi:polysaccharide biosynthesis tyrosine autokinase [Psychrobacter pygoscelis]|uniref:polysaccharide biosynthesis tyrosine autokinase n=1 Tax=Psychrobacter pygoscelis TaxID=2488563 RepID=UPI00103D1ED7|nr:polysaccharide biosynthesis tyrosine autokinase [Psychrobacter pygoscelis]